MAGALCSELEMSIQRKALSLISVLKIDLTSSTLLADDIPDSQNSHNIAGNHEVNELLTHFY